MDKRKIKNADFYKNISYINMKKAYVSSIVSCLLLPVLAFVTLAFLGKNVSFKTPIIVCYILAELVQICYLFLIRMEIKNDEFDSFKKTYLSYYGLTIAFMMIFAGVNMHIFDSVVVYVCACLYFIFVPVVEEKERLAFVGGMTAIMVVLIAALQLHIHCVADVCLIQIGIVFLSGYQHNSVVKRENTNNKLKKKTDNSEHDALTGLLNRRGLERRAAAIWPYCERHRVAVGIIAIDIDFFKKYNDSFGHPAGDRCLKLVADALKESAQRSTDFVTRTGGEEFLIFVQDTGQNNLVSLAMKIRKNIEDKAIPQAYCAVSKNVTVSIGAASFVPSYNNSFDQLYEEADKALYTAKKNGRNCIVYDGNLYGRIRNGMAQVVSM